MPNINSVELTAVVKYGDNTEIRLASNTINTGYAITKAMEKFILKYFTLSGEVHIGDISDYVYLEQFIFFLIRHVVEHNQIIEQEFDEENEFWKNAIKFIKAVDKREA